MCRKKLRRTHNQSRSLDLICETPGSGVASWQRLPGLSVQKVSAFGDHCGPWQMVKAFANTKVKFVSAGADVRIQYVSAFPGAN
jgi:hypothetical protein